MGPPCLPPSMAAIFSRRAISEDVRMGIGTVVGVLAKVDQVLSNRRVQGALGVQPQPPTCGQDQRLDILIVEIRELNRSIDQLMELQAAALQLAVDQARPASTMELLPEMESGSKRKR